MLVAGIDSSTQSTKVVLCEAENGTVIDEGKAPHPDGTECDPEAWWAALRQAGDGLLDRAAAVGVAAQQHGMVTLDGDGKVVRPALLWNDVRSAKEAGDLVTELGATDLAERIGSVPTASFTITKLRWMAEHEPEHAARTSAVTLPHDWLTWRLGGCRELTTDRGDASGTGYWSPRHGQWLPDLSRRALGHDIQVPRVVAPGEIVGETSTGAVVSAGTGDNMGAALGLGLEPGDVVVSIGTSGTAFAVAESPTADPSGTVAGFADATGRFLPLVCTLNAAKVLTTTAELLGISVEHLSELALRANPGADGLTLLPYLDGERTPNRPYATGVLHGLTSTTMTQQNMARAAVEALLASLADAVDHLREQGVTPRRALLIGGGARSEAVTHLAPGLLGLPVSVPEPAEYVSLGAARQAAWALAGTAEPPPWRASLAAEEASPNTDHAAQQTEVRRRYASLRDDTASWKGREQ